MVASDKCRGQNNVVTAGVVFICSDWRRLCKRSTGRQTVVYQTQQGRKEGATSEVKEVMDMPHCMGPVSCGKNSHCMEPVSVCEFTLSKPPRTMWMA